MTPPTLDLPATALVALTRDSFLALRGALFRDVGLNAASLLQEAGYAGGASWFDAFAAWLAARGLPAPDALPAAEFGARASEFFRDAGWGSLDVGTLERVATVDSADWTEGDPTRPMDYPGCYYTSGMLADFFGRLAGAPLAAMEVECRSMGHERCRFLIGGADVIQRVYDEMTTGAPYEQAVAAAG